MSFRFLLVFPEFSFFFFCGVERSNLAGNSVKPLQSEAPSFKSSSLSPSHPPSSPLFLSFFSPSLCTLVFLQPMWLKKKVERKVAIKKLLAAAQKKNASAKSEQKSSAKFSVVPSLALVKKEKQQTLTNCQSVEDRVKVPLGGDVHLLAGGGRPLTSQTHCRLICVKKRRTKQFESFNLGTKKTHNFAFNKPMSI